MCFHEVAMMTRKERIHETFFFFLPGAQIWHSSGRDKWKNSELSLGLSFVLGKDNGVPVTQGHWKKTKVEMAFPSFLDRRGLCQWGNFLHLPSVLDYFVQCRISASCKPVQMETEYWTCFNSPLTCILCWSVPCCAYHFHWYIKSYVCYFSLTQKSVAEWERRIQHYLPNLVYLTAQTFRWTGAAMFTFSEVLRIKYFT